MKNKKVKKSEPDISLDKNHVFYILAGLTVVGAFLRFYQLGFNSLWLDEISTFNYASGTLEQMWGFMATGTDYTPPLFFLFEKISLMIFGAGEWQMRLFPAIFGIATIPVIYYVGKEFWDDTVGLVAAGLVTFSPFLILYSQEARAYSLVLLLCAIEFYFLAKAVKNGRNDYWIYFGLFAGLALWTHFYSVIFTIALLVYVAYKCWHYKNYLPIFISGITFAVVTLPITLSLVSLFQQRTTSAPTYGYQGLLIIYQSIIQIGGYTASIAVFIFAAALCGLIWLYTKDKNRFATLALILGITWIASFILSYKIPMIPRYLIFMFIPLSLGVGMLCDGIRQTFEIKSKTLIGIFLVIFFLTSLPIYPSYYTKYTKEDWKGISLNLAGLTHRGDMVVVVPTYIELPLEYYYNSTNDGTTVYGAMNISDLAMLELKTYSEEQFFTQWYVVTGDIKSADTSGKAFAWLQENTVVVQNYGNVLILRGK